jgi:uncharacterized membrane protein
VSGYAWGAVLFVVVFFGLGAALVFLLFGTRQRATSGATGVPVTVGGVTVHVGGS